MEQVEQAPVIEQEGEEKMSKAQLKKLAKQKEKEEQKAKNAEKAVQNNQQSDQVDLSKDLYGNYGHMGSFFAKH